MASFVEALNNAAVGAFCNVLGNVATAEELLNSRLGQFRRGGALGRAAYNLACNRPAPELPAPPFSGGQCDQSYQVTISYTVPNVSLPPFNGTSVSIQRGRIQAVQPFVDGNNLGIRIVHGSAGNPNASISTTVAAFFNAIPNGDLPIIINSVVIVPEGGGSDTCGDPPPAIPPYTPGDNSVTTNVTYNDNDNTEITVPVVIAFGYANVNIDGTISIPVEINASLNPEVNLNGELNLNGGDVNFNFGNPSLPGSDCQPNSDSFNPDPSLPANPVDIPDEEDDPDPSAPKPQVRRLLKGCIATVSTPSPQASVIFQGDNPDIYVPSLGYVSFQITVGGRSAWTADIPVKNKRQFIPCPWEGGATNVKGTPAPGGSLVVTPVYLSYTDGLTFPND